MYEQAVCPGDVADVEQTRIVLFGGFCSAKLRDIERANTFPA